MEPRRSTLRWASEYVVTSERAGNALLVMATIALIVTFCLPWLSVSYGGGWVANRTVTTYGFSGWGLLSFAAALVAFALTGRLIVARGTSLGEHLAARSLGLITVGAGAAELLGNALFLAAAPKTEVFISYDQVATRGMGLTIAIVAGVVLVASGLLMLVSANRHEPASDERGAAHMLVG